MQDLAATVAKYPRSSGPLFSTGIILSLSAGLSVVGPELKYEIGPPLLHAGCFCVTYQTRLIPQSIHLHLLPSWPHCKRDVEEIIL